MERWKTNWQPWPKVEAHLMSERQGDTQIERTAVKVPSWMPFKQRHSHCHPHKPSVSASMTERDWENCREQGRASVMSSRKVREVKATTCIYLTVPDTMTVNSVITLLSGRQPVLPKLGCWQEKPVRHAFTQVTVMDTYFTCMIFTRTFDTITNSNEDIMKQMR